MRVVTGLPEPQPSPLAEAKGLSHAARAPFPLAVSASQNGSARDAGRAGRLVSFTPIRCFVFPKQKQLLLTAPLACGPFPLPSMVHCIPAVHHPL